MPIQQFTASEGLALIGGFVILLMFLVILFPILILIIGKLMSRRSRFIVNNTDAFKSDDYFKMNWVISILQGILIVLILIMGIVGGAMAGFSSAVSQHLPFEILILIVPYLQWAIIILICAEILLFILERSRKRTNIFKDLYQNYATFYEKNNIPISGKCQICFRAIPQYYALDKKISSDFLAKHSVCFQADGQHIVTMQQQESNSFFEEFKKLFRKIKSTWNYWFYAYIISLIYYILMATILTNYIGPAIIDAFLEPTSPDYYYMLSMVQGIGPAIAVIILIPINFIGKYASNSLIIKRLYFDNFYDETKGALEDGIKLPIEFIHPPDYNEPGDELPSFIETLKEARKLAKNIKGVTSALNSVSNVKNVVQLAQTTNEARKGIVDIRNDTKDFIDEHSTSSISSNLTPGRTDSNLAANKEMTKKDSSDTIDKIKKLKELLDMKAITQEEFEAKKKILLEDI